MLDSVTTTSAPKPPNSPGLCETCAHGKKIVSDRGSTFWQCALSATDPHFPKYPRLPVVECAGFVKTCEARHG